MRQAMRNNGEPVASGGIGTRRAAPEQRRGSLVFVAAHFGTQAD